VLTTEDTPIADGPGMTPEVAALTGAVGTSDRSLVVAVDRPTTNETPSRTMIAKAMSATRGACAHDRSAVAEAGTVVAVTAEPSFA